jgi:hypothetical protein
MKVTECDLSDIAASVALAKENGTYSDYPCCERRHSELQRTQERHAEDH